MKRFAGWMMLAAVVVGLDQWSKLAILARFAEHEARPVTEYFNLVLVYNTGAAFSLFADQPGWQRWFFVVLAAAICAWLLRMVWQHRAEVLQPAAFSLVIGGAVGNNFIDRIAYGKVVDFLDVHVCQYAWADFLGSYCRWPAFNIADSAICLGVVLMLIAQFRGDRSVGAAHD